MKKKLVMGFGVCALAFGLAACGGEEDTTQGQDPTQEEPVVSEHPEGVEQPEQAMGSMIDTEEIPDVVATVNGEDIEKEMFVTTIEQQAMQVAMQGIDLESEEGVEYLEELKDQVLDQIINSKLIADAASNEGLEATEEEIDNGISELMAQNGLESEEQLQELLEAQGVQMDELRDDVKKNVKSSKYIEQKVTEIEISDEEIQAFYDEAIVNATEDESQLPSLEEVRSDIEYQLQMESLISTLKEKSDVTINI
ncbi:SurA N-terminal domain-containing protein [Alkalihalobacillus deserti]|uniref:SurA N-terminal domain-containing protein n=1 Tax=Alkalihalobacillus deserti TaxID=2879466 RepID=UPI001D142DE4|nr:SurA N-terminal domain-containing protein [Alkalihalobacillus deserti]